MRDDQLDRYARHIVLKEVGGAGQRALLGATVAVVGAGGLGSPCLLYLAAAGVGRITVIDDDTVALSNLQRQVLYATADVGRAKTAAAGDALARLNPDVVVSPVATRLDTANAAALLAGHDVVADGSDSFATRLAVADAALALRIPLVSAAVGPFEGQLATFRGWEADRPCYRCFVGADPGRDEASCADQGILGAVAGVLGSLQALEVIRAITGFGPDQAGKLLLFDALSLADADTGTGEGPRLPGVRTSVMAGRGLAIVVGEAGPRLATALTLAAAAAALGRDVTMLFDGASVTALVAPDAALATALDLGVRVVACQSGLADAGIAAADLPPGVVTGGMVSFVAAAGDAQLLLA